VNGEIIAAAITVCVVISVPVRVTSFWVGSNSTCSSIGCFGCFGPSRTRFLRARRDVPQSIYMAVSLALRGARIVASIVDPTKIGALFAFKSLCQPARPTY
jgi:hypothetical protein